MFSLVTFFGYFLSYGHFTFIIDRPTWGSYCVAQNGRGIEMGTVDGDSVMREEWVWLSL